MERRILIAGFGGQGVMLMGQLMGHAACIEDKEVIFLPTYGAEQRGGTANCTVIISDEPIGSANVDKFDIVVAMNEPSFEKYKNALNPEGTLIVNSDFVSSVQETYRQIAVPAEQLAAQAGSLKTINMIMLGVLAKVSGVITLEGLSGAVQKKLAKKAEMLEWNIKAIQSGFSYVD